jgi:predicted DNA-binding protein with PD1-like motif
MIRNVSFAAIGLVMAFAANAQAPQAAQYQDRSEATPHGMAPKMKVTEMHAGRSFQVLFSKGDEVASGLLDFAEKNHVKYAHFTAVGAFDHAVLGWFDPVKRAQKRNPLDEEVEVTSFVGNITPDAKGNPVVHAHCVVALSDGRAMAGHFIEGHVSLVMQVYVEELEPVTSASK